MAKKKGLHFVDPVMDGPKRYWYQIVDMRKDERRLLLGRRFDID
jgi:hypothetical protein